jgi:UDP-N-acetylglucosamine--N-acetylmuramyl-(pentapeptide) pyrophosphoryl-undecaprenol N-acetylglucosamine transferase
MPAPSDASKIFIGACGIGLGHVGRMLPVAKILRERGWRVYFSTYGDASNYSINEGFPTIKERELSYGSKSDGSLSLKETFRVFPRVLLSFLSQVEREFSALRALKPNVVLSDSRLSTLIAARVLGYPSILVMHEFKMLIPLQGDELPGIGFVKRFFERVALETFGLGWDLADRVLITDFPPPFTVCKPNVVLPEFLRHKATYVGMVSPEKLDISKDTAKKKFGFNEKTIVVYFGLSGLPWERKSMASKLFPLALETSKKGFGVIFSRGEPGGSSAPKREGSVVVYDWIPDRRLAYAAADVFVTVGGQTSVGEALRYGTPMIVIPTPNHTEHDSIGENIQAMGLGLKINFRELESERFFKALEIVLSERFKKRAIEAAKNASRYEAVREIVRAIERFVE